jgi:hypothetical protein
MHDVADIDQRRVYDFTMLDRAAHGFNSFVGGKFPVVAQRPNYN